MKRIIKGFLILTILLLTITFYKHSYYRPYTRICSWNIEFFGLVDVHDNTQSYYQEIAKRMVVSDPDIICLQEVSSIIGANFLLNYLPGYSLLIDDKLANKNHQMFNASSLDNVLSQISSATDDNIVTNLLMNCFLVKKHIRIKDFFTIHPRCIKLTYFDKHVGNGEYITIYNFHLPSDYSENNSRTRENILTDFIYNTPHPKKKNIILCGDFNTTSEKELSVLTENGFHDSRDIISCLPHHQTIHPSDMWSTMKWNVYNNRDINIEGRKESRVDYFFVSKYLFRHVIGGFTDKTQCNGNLGDIFGEISDHCAIYMDIS